MSMARDEALRHARVQLPPGTHSGAAVQAEQTFALLKKQQELLDAKHPLPGEAEQPEHHQPSQSALARLVRTSLKYTPGLARYVPSL